MDGGVECTVTSDSKTVKAAGHRVTQDQRAHNGGSAGPNLRVGSYGAERGSSRDGRNRISGLGHLRATAAATAPTMSRAATAGRRREAGSVYRCVAAGVKPKTTVRERCDGARVRRNPSYPLPLGHCWDGQTHLAPVSLKPV